MFKNKNTMLM